MSEAYKAVAYAKYMASEVGSAAEFQLLNPFKIKMTSVLSACTLDVKLRVTTPKVIGTCAAAVFIHPMALAAFESAVIVAGGFAFREYIVAKS